MTKKELVIAGTRLYSGDGQVFHLTPIHLTNPIEFVALNDCHLLLSPVRVSETLTVKAYLGDKSLLTSDIPLDYQAPSRVFFGRTVFVMGRQPFYISTGRSNMDTGNNFPGVAFPFQGMDFRGWFIKCYGNPNAEWFMGLGETDGKTSLFLQRFETFDQLKTSAIVSKPGSYWDKIRRLHRFVMRHEWNGVQFIRAKVSCIQRPFSNPPKAKNQWEVNDWLREMGAELSVGAYK